MKRPPLEGIRVADLSMMWAGPYATRVLAEMGAEVIKIESTRAWDNIRTLIPQPGIEDPWNSSYYFNDYNRDKKSLTLDLSDPRGRDIFLRLVRECDVVLENYRADVMEKLNLGYDVLRGARQDIILISMAGFGKTGSERDNVGFGPIIEQMSGLASLTGYGDDGEPYKTGVSYGDPVAGLAAAAAVALALIKRRKTGRGSAIDLPQRENMATMLGEAFVAASLRGETPTHHGNRSPRFAPQGAYRCAGDDQWVVVSVRSDAEWAALGRIIGATALAELPFAERQARHDELDAAISAWSGVLDPAVAADTLQRAGVPAARVFDSAAIHDDSHLLARGFWVELPHPKMHAWKQPRGSWRFAEANPNLRRHAPLFGEHNAEILQGLLGLGDAELAALATAGIIGTAPNSAGPG